MRRIAFLAAVAAALACATAASSALQPLRRSHAGDLALTNLVKPVRIPPQHVHGRVRVIVRLDAPPLAAAFSEGLAAESSSRRLNVESSASRRYVSQLQTMQAEAAREIREAIPGALVSRRFQVLLNGITVELPARRLADLAALPLASKIYPSLAYRLSLNESPGLIKATSFWATTGLRGEGMKIGVVDDGVDHKHAFFSPTGMSYPPGFPKGGRRWTTPKVIVARAFAGPGSGRPGRLPLDRRASFHGTHVAGIAAGRSGTSSPGGSEHPPIANLSGVAPNAWIGMYEVPCPATSERRHVEPSPLSPKEAQVLRGLSDGKRYREIADDLGLSTSTVRTHLSNTYKKLGVEDRAQAVLAATERGWL